MNVDITLDLTDPSNIIGTVVKYKDEEGNTMEEIIVSFVKENNYIKFYVAGGQE